MRTRAEQIQALAGAVATLHEASNFEALRASVQSQLRQVVEILKTYDEGTPVEESGPEPPPEPKPKGIVAKVRKLRG